jgi:P-type Mg2+ transporter
VGCLRHLPKPVDRILQTSNLALSAVRVARRKVIVKQFDAIQNLGAVSVLCSDKTGTLTIDMVQLSVSIGSDGARSELPLKLAYINSSLQTGTRSLLDGAIVSYMRETVFKSASEGGGSDDYPNLDNWAKVAEVPFDSSRRLLSVLVSRELGEKGLLITKGAVEEVLERCIQVYQEPSSSSSPSLDVLDHFKPNDSPPLTADVKREILEIAEKSNRDGLRLVAVACRSAVAMKDMTLSPADERDLVFMGFLGFLDPVKPDAAEAVQSLARLGVQAGHFLLSIFLIILMVSLLYQRFEFSLVTPRL